MDASDQAQGPKKAPTLEWMYKPAALVDREEYLTGRSVDKSLKLLDEIEKGNNPNEFNYLQEAEKDLTPLSIFASQGSCPVDIIKKIKDDPLYQIQKKEQESLKQLLQNPVKMKQLNKLVELRQAANSSSSSKSKHHEHKSKDKVHKHHKHKDDRRKQRDSSSSEDRERSKRRERRHSRDNSDDRGNSSSRKRLRESSDSYSRKPQRNKKDSTSDSDSSDDDVDHEKRRQEIIEKFKKKVEERSKADSNSKNNEKYNQRKPVSTEKSCFSQSSKKKLDEDELERRRNEMMENAKWREQQRTKNVTKYREEAKKEEEKIQTPRNPDFIRKQLLEAANTGSVEQRVKSNSYNIQRSKASMNQNFLKR